MANLVSDKFKNSLKSSMKEHIINFLERKRLSGSPYERLWRIHEIVRDHTFKDRPKNK